MRTHPRGALGIVPRPRCKHVGPFIRGQAAREDDAWAQVRPVADLGGCRQLCPEGAHCWDAVLFGLLLALFALPVLIARAACAVCAAYAFGAAGGKQ